MKLDEHLVEDPLRWIIKLPENSPSGHPMLPLGRAPYPVVSGVLEAIDSHWEEETVLQMHIFRRMPDD